MSKNEILMAIRDAEETNTRNSMGCNESWYNSYYAIRKTFSEAELENMSEETLNALVTLGDSMSDAFY